MYKTEVWLGRIFQYIEAWLLEAMWCEMEAMFETFF
jgi:hypothetical protein